MQEDPKRPSDKYSLMIEDRLKDEKQWPSLEAYAISYLRDRFKNGPVGWHIELSIEKIYLALCFGKERARYSALKALYELWTDQVEKVPDTIRVH